MSNFRSIFAIIFVLVMVAMSSAIELPSIDTPLPFGANAIALPAPELINDTNPRTIQLLAEELERPETPPDRKAELIRDLGRTHLPAAIAPLMKAAADPDPDIRAAAAGALRILNHPGGVQTVAQLTDDPNPEVRAEAILVASVLGRADLIAKGLHDADSNVVAAALSLASAGDSMDVASHIVDSNERLRVLAIDAVARAKMTPCADSVAKQLGTDVPTTIAAVRALGQIGARNHAREILGLLDHTHPTIRREATTALLGVLPADEAKVQAIRMLNDADESVRTSAARVLVNAPGSDAVEPLVKQLQDPYAPLREAARAALVAARDAAVPAAVKLIDDPDPRRREDGSYLLGMLASDAAFERHIKLLDDADWDVVAQAAKSLGQISNRAAGPDLARTLDRALTFISKAESKSLKAPASAATNAVLSATQLKYAPIAIKASACIFEKQTYPSNLRAASLWAVGVLGTPDEASVFDQLPALLADQYEDGTVKIEAYKAIGNRRHTASKGILDDAAKYLTPGQASAIVHWSRDRLNGTVRPYTIPPQKFRSETSVIAIPVR